MSGVVCSGGARRDTVARACYSGRASDVTASFQSQPASTFLLEYGAPFLLPQIKPTQQSCRVRNAFRFERDHRTGGRMFLRSRTVGHYHFVARKIVDVLQNVVRGDERRAGNVPQVP